VISSYCYGGSGDDDLSGISGNANGTSTFNASTTSNDGQVSGNHGIDDIWLVNIDNYNGNIIWQKCIGGSAIDNPHALSRTSDGNIVLSIASNSSDGDFTGSTSGCAAGFTAKLIKANPETGAVIWNKSYPAPGRCTVSFGTLVTTDGGVLSMGVITDTPTPSNHDAHVFKVDSEGNLLWDISIGGSKSDNVVYWKTGIEINNQYLIPFTSQSKDGDILNPLGGADGWIVTLGSGCSQRMTTGINYSNEVAIYPNPVSNTTTILFSLSQTGKASLKIFDVNGRLVSTLADQVFYAGENKVFWNACELSSGVYMLQIETESYSGNQKLIVTK
jgi:hypothetical protein